MRVILGGKFENALIRACDAVNRPNRNQTSHPYYLGLNRRTDRSYFERASTFIAISNDVVMPVADWSSQPESRGKGIDGTGLGIVTAQSGYNEWDKDATEFADLLLKNRAFSASSQQYIEQFDMDDIPVDERPTRSDIRKLKVSLSRHYLCRLILQIRSAQNSDCFLVLDEKDIGLCSEIAEFLKAAQFELSFSFPDIDAKIILGQEFAGGAFNFAPRDILSTAAIRSDQLVKKYAESIRAYVADASSEYAERRLIEGMRIAYKEVGVERKINKAFEIGSFIIKPLHYLPVFGNVLAAAEDATDIAMRLLNSDREERGWHLLAARASEINIEDYLKRKSNL